MKILIAGDSHGEKGILWVDEQITKYNADCGIICGDVWDVWTRTKNEIAIIRGNHEKEEAWTKKLFGPNIIPHQDYSTFTLGGKRFGVIGRMDEDAHQYMLKAGWWLGDADNRAFTKYEMSQVKGLLKNIDVLLTHDAPFPFLIAEDGMMGGAPNTVGSHYLRDVLFVTQPQYAWHGHMHAYQERRIADVKVFGLPCSDVSFNNRGFCILDTQDMSVETILINKPRSAEINEY